MRLSATEFPIVRAKVVYRTMRLVGASRLASVKIALICLGKMINGKADHQSAYRDEMRNYIEWQRLAVEDARRHEKQLRDAITNFENAERTANGKANHQSA